MSGHTPRGTAMANSTRHTEAPRVEGHTLRGQDTSNSTHLPTRNTASQVMVVTSLSSYYLKGQLAGQHSKILLDTCSALILVRTDQWKHQDALTQPSAEKQLRLVGVDGNPLSLCGTACTHLKLGGKAFPIEVTVVDNITADVRHGIAARRQWVHAEPNPQEQLLQVLQDHRKAFSDGPHDHGRTN